MRLRKLAVAASVALALAGCVPPAPEPTPAPTPAPSAPAQGAATSPSAGPALPPPLPSANWADNPATPGDWLYRAAGADRIAEFRSPAGAQLFQLICTVDGDMMLAVIGRVPGARAITIRTETLSRALSADAMEGSVATVLTPQDPLLEAMAFSKGRFAVEVTGAAPLFLPAFPEVTRVIEDCRS